MKRKTSWQALSGKQYKDTTAGRDIYNDQQIERQDLPEMQSITSRLILCIIAGILSAVLFYAFWAAVCSFGSGVSGLSKKGGSAVSESSGQADGSLQGDAYGEASGDADGSLSASADGYGYADASYSRAPMEGTEQDPSYGGQEQADASGGSSGIAGIKEGGYQFKSKTLGGSGFEEGSDLEKSDYEGLNGTGGGYRYGTADGSYGYGAEGEADLTAVPAEDLSKEDSSTLEASGDTDGRGSSGSLSGVSVTRKKKRFRWRPYSVEQVFFSLLVGVGVFGVLYELAKRNLKGQNMMADTTDINQYKNDQHLMLPEEIHRSFDWFPDSGAHAPVLVNSLISHSMVSNKGIDPVYMTCRYKEDMKDEETGEIICYEGEAVLDADGNPVMEVKPLFDRSFGEKLFDSVFVDRIYRRYYNPSRIPYNPEKKRGKMPYDTVADFINKEWEFPDYEVQRPGGAYLVDTAPVNCLVLAITRAGKGELARPVW